MKSEQIENHKKTNNENIIYKKEDNENKKEEKKNNSLEIIGKKENEENKEIKKENKNKKRKKIKVKAYCGKCYQFFENGPYSKICKNHLEKSCNLIECQKFRHKGEKECIRKFTNINSANRHTHCLTKDEIDIWDPNWEIHKCLGKKTEPDNKFLDILNSNINNSNNFFNGINKINMNKSFSSELNNNSLNLNMNNMNNLFFEKNDNFFDTNSNNGNNNVMDLIEDIGKLHFNENDKIFGKGIKGYNIENNKENNNEKDINSKLEKMNLNEEKKEQPLQENESIDEFFEKVQKETNIPNHIKKKLVNAFKKKGILNVKILLLFYEKHKNWDFLIEKFKNVTSQIEGVALCIEFLLKKNSEKQL